MRDKKISILSRGLKQDVELKTEVNDEESCKEMYLTNYYSLTLLYKTQIREIYKFQKF